MTGHSLGEGELVGVSRETLRAMLAGIVDWRLDHPHVTDTAGLDRTEHLIQTALAAEQIGTGEGYELTGAEQASIFSILLNLESVAKYRALSDALPLHSTSNVFGILHERNVFNNMMALAETDALNHLKELDLQAITARWNAQWWRRHAPVTAAPAAAAADAQNGVRRT